MNTLKSYRICTIRGQLLAPHHPGYADFQTALLVAKGLLPRFYAGLTIWEWNDGIKAAILYQNEEPQILEVAA